MSDENPANTLPAGGEPVDADFDSQVPRVRIIRSDGVVLSDFRSLAFPRAGEGYSFEGVLHIVDSVQWSSEARSLGLPPDAWVGVTRLEPRTITPKAE